MVVRRDAPPEEMRRYIHDEVAKGLPHVRSLIETDRDSVLAAVAGISEEEGTRVTLEGEWTPAQILAHLTRTLPSNLLRLQTLSSGRQWTPSAFPDSDPNVSFEGLRQQYVENMQAIIDVLAGLDPEAGKGLTADHPKFGPFNWMHWALYSHHVHTSDHIGQPNEARARLKGGT